MGYNTNIPWEFTSSKPARSYVPLFVLYYPILKFSQFLGLELPLQIWYLARLALMVLSWMVTDWCLFKMLPTKQERIKAIYFTLTSYVTLVYQSHCFSNSLETVLVVAAVYIINEFRFISSQDDSQYSQWDLAKLAAFFGAIVSFGVFTRITFPAFLILPSVFLLPIFWKWKQLPFIAAFTFLLTSYASVVLDTVVFEDKGFQEVLSDPFSFSNYIITPLNSLLYNANTANLALHGIHPYYTHIVANLPQIIGPGLLFLFFRFRNRYWRTTPFLAAVSGIVFLSVVPHQELRFLIPVVPLLCCCFDLSLGYDEEAKKASPMSSLLMFLWLVFNVALSLLMGVLHQGGVVPALTHLHDLKLDNTIQVWWRTYSPPTWMLGDLNDEYQYITLNTEFQEFELDETKRNYVIDAMGTDQEILKALLNNLQNRVLLITPVATFSTHFDPSRFDKKWSTILHLDLDHLDWSDFRTLQPGLAIYELI